jgi:pyruvate kinase
VASEGAARWAVANKTAYVAEGTRLELRQREGGDPVRARVGALPGEDLVLVLHRGDRLVLTRDPAPGRRAVRAENGAAIAPASVPCTLPEVFGRVRAGHRILFDDGRIGGVVRGAHDDRLDVEITGARVRGERLRSDKGVNLPDTDLGLPPLTSKDIDDLPTIAKHADVVGYSFVRSPEGVHELSRRLDELGREDAGLVLKIESRPSFERLPELLLAVMRRPRAGVMIARGDLAVECGFERLAEIQEEILWICEAAHVPVIWATAVLDQLAKRGAPTRAEITDAAMSERAECVMLNKGPHILEALAVLDDILRRMESHQNKKSALLRRLRSW